jgi:hypothetical protein
VQVRQPCGRLRRLDLRHWRRSLEFRQWSSPLDRMPSRKRRLTFDVASRVVRVGRAEPHTWSNFTHPAGVPESGEQRGRLRPGLREPCRAIDFASKGVSQRRRATRWPNQATSRGSRVGWEPSGPHSWSATAKGRCNTRAVSPRSTSHFEAWPSRQNFTS